MTNGKISLELLKRKCKEAHDLAKKILAQERNPALPEWIDSLVCLLEIAKRDALQEEDCEMIAFASCWIYRMHCVAQEFYETDSKADDMIVSIRQMGDEYRAYPSSTGQEYGQFGGRTVARPALYFVEKETCPHARKLRATFEKYSQAINHKYRIIYLDADDKEDQKEAQRLIEGAGRDPYKTGVPALITYKQSWIGSAEGVREAELLEWLEIM